MGYPFPAPRGDCYSGSWSWSLRWAPPHPAAQRYPARQRNAARQPPAVPAHRPSPRGHRDGGHRWDGAPMRTCPHRSRRFPATSSSSLPWHPHRTSMAHHAPQRRAGRVADRGDTRHDLSGWVCRGSSFSGAARFGSTRPVPTWGRAARGRPRPTRSWISPYSVRTGGVPDPAIRGHRNSRSPNQFDRLLERER